MDSRGKKKYSELGEKLPFVPRRNGDWGGWVYDRRYGITISILVWFVLIFLFMSIKIPLVRHDAGAILIDLERSAAELQQLMEQERQLREEIAMNAGSDFREVQNLTSNDATERENAAGDMGRQAAEMTAEARAMAERLSSSRDAYEEGLASAREILDSPRAEGENGAQTNRSVRRMGNVTVRYSLEGRYGTDLPIPAYQCEGGGEVTVNILVNRSGRVVDATVAKGATAAKCHIDKAVSAARSSQFNADVDAPERQQGTITYIFIPQ